MAQQQEPLGLFLDQRAKEMARIVADRHQQLSVAWAFASVSDAKGLEFALSELDANTREKFCSHLKQNWWEADQHSCLL